MTQRHPCLSCGACCAFFRVSFHWLEATESNAPSENPVPIEWTEDLPPHRLCMKGTNQKPPRCAALAGQVGEYVACAIYQSRPSPCREFGIEFIDGRIVADAAELARCNLARAAWNLPPLIFGEYEGAREEEGSTT